MEIGGNHGTTWEQEMEAVHSLGPIVRLNELNEQMMMMEYPLVLTDIRQDEPGGECG